jgi:hypothetical protein
VTANVAQPHFKANVLACQASPNSHPALGHKDAAAIIPLNVREYVCVAKPRGGSRSILKDHAERILALVHEQPDRTLDELVAAMRKRRIPGSRSALWQFLDRHDITFKKKA